MIAMGARRYSTKLGYVFDSVHENTWRARINVHAKFVNLFCFRIRSGFCLNLNLFV